MGDYAPKRRYWERPGGPCPECGSTRCKTVTSFACWVRAHHQALHAHQFMRCGAHSRKLRDADVPIILAPQPAGNEVMFAPSWAVLQLAALREAGHQNGRKLSSREVRDALQADPRHGPAPPSLLTRLEELRAFAALRGWTYRSGMWSR